MMHTNEKNKPLSYVHLKKRVQYHAFHYVFSLCVGTGVARIFQQGGKARERSDRAGEGVGGGCPPFHGIFREIFLKIRV